jgi:hypothetical protein
MSNFSGNIDGTNKITYIQHVLDYLYENKQEHMPVDHYNSFINSLSQITDDNTKLFNLLIVQIEEIINNIPDKNDDSIITNCERTIKSIKQNVNPVIKSNTDTINQMIEEIPDNKEKEEVKSMFMQVKLWFMNKNNMLTIIDFIKDIYLEFTNGGWDAVGKALGLKFGNFLFKQKLNDEFHSIIRTIFNLLKKCWQLFSWYRYGRFILSICNIICIIITIPLTWVLIFFTGINFAITKVIPENIMEFITENNPLLPDFEQDEEFTKEQEKREKLLVQEQEKEKARLAKEHEKQAKLLAKSTKPKIDK